MPPVSGAPLRKVTLNLYDEDCYKAEALFGHGWSSELREIIHRFFQQQQRRRFLGDTE